MNRLRIFFLLLFWGALIIVAEAQVTIGSDIPPQEGVLLQLTEGAVTVKGLNLPRVILSNKYNLYPMFIDDNAGGYVNAVKADEDKKHIGLVVYALYKFGDLLIPEKIYCPGVYLWDGKEWTSLPKQELNPDIIMTDADGNKYTAKWFTKDPCDPTNGAYWTTSNLYTTKDVNGTLFSGGVRFNPGRLTDAPSVSSLTINSVHDILVDAPISYGESSDMITTPNVTLSRKDFIKRFGLLYNLNQAKAACPKGWHLPTHAEWVYLVEAIAGTFQLGGAKMRMSKSFYIANDRLDIVSNWGKNDPENIKPSGFDALPSGAIATFLGGNATRFFGNSARWWAADNQYSRVMHGSDPGIWFEQGTNFTYYLSVRCVKD